MKILHVCWDLGQGGIQRYLVDLLRCHNHDFHNEVIVLSTPGVHSEEVRELAGAVDYLGMKNGLSIRAFFSLIKRFRSGDHHVIHSHANNILLNLALHFQSKPVVYTEHGGRFLSSRIASPLQYRYLSSGIDRFIAISRFMGDLMCARNPRISDRLRVIHNGVDYNLIAATDSSEHVNEARKCLPPGPKVGFVGRLTIDKGIDLFIEAARMVCQSNPETRFVVTGDGPSRHEMENRVREYGLGNNVTFLGYRDDARELMGALDICLVTSRYEAFGLVIVEALAAGVPVIAMAQNSAASEVIRDGVDGFVVEGLDVAAAASLVVKLLNDVALRARLSGAGKARVKSCFSIESNAREVARQYCELAGSGV